MRVAVVGAGPSGLACCKILLDQPEIQNVTVYDQASRLGGQWAYSAREGVGDNGVVAQSSVYKGMRTTYPKEFQTFPNFDYADDVTDGSYLTHEQILQYLDSYAEKFCLSKHIRLSTRVDSVTPIGENSRNVTWELLVGDVTKSSRHQQRFLYDAVFVCNGKDIVPWIPDVPGLDTFPGQLLHSRDYRNPDPFVGQRVLCLGAGRSGMELSYNISFVADQVFLCKKRSRQVSVPGVQIKAQVESISGSTAILEDGSTIDQLDTIIMCTGYRPSFPFLAEKCKVKVDDGHVTPLYKHVVHAHWRSLLFVCICRYHLGFRHLYLQAEFAVGALLRKFDLPTESEMLKDIEEDFIRKSKMGLRKRMAHDVYPFALFDQYHADLKSLSGPWLTELPERLRLGADVIMELVRHRFSSYRDSPFVWSAALNGC